MSEKIYAYLLRLYPPAFRRRYEREALQLLRDRLRDERGCLRRLRLIFDLMMDMIRALPQAYGNSYAEVAAVASIPRPLNGIPSFQSLRNEPIRRGVFIVATVLTLTALMTFGYVMELPISDPAVQGNGRKSAIESVLEHLNKPISFDSTENGHSAAPKSIAGSSVSKPENREPSAINAARPADARFPSNMPSQTVAPDKQNPIAKMSEGVPSRAATASRSLAVLGRQFVQNLAVAVRGRIAPNTQAHFASLSGKWTESLHVDGRDADIPRQFIFNQNGAVLSGSYGPDLNDQFPIIRGSVAGDSVSFELNHGRNVFFYDLKGKGDELRGTLSIRSANETRTITVRLERAD